MPTWLTYDEIAERRRISRLSAHKLVRRNKWERRPMGDGSPLVQVLVPSDKIVREQSPPRTEVEMLRAEVALLRREVAGLGERLSRNVR